MGALLSCLRAEEPAGDKAAGPAAADRYGSAVAAGPKLLPQLNPAEEILNSVIYGGSGAIAVCGGEVRSGE
jgi:hypothetical protein